MAIDKKKKERARQWLQDVNNEFDTLTNRLRAKWLDWWKIYRLFENEMKMPGQSNLFIPKVFEIIEKKVPLVVKHNPKFIVSARTNEASETIGIIRETLDYWWYLNKMRALAEKWVKDSFIFGVGLVKVDWSQNIKKETVIDTGVDENGEIIQAEVEEYNVVSENPTAKTVSIFDIKVDPRVESFQEGVGILHFIDNVRYSSLYEMKDKYDLSDFDADCLYASGGQQEVSPEATEQLEEKAIDQQVEKIDKNKIMLCDFWGLFSPTGEPEDEYEYHIVAIMKDNEPYYIIQCEESELDFRPFVKLIDRVVPGEFYGIGEVEPLESLQIEYNNLRNSRTDFNNSINFPEWMYNKNANINPAHLIHKPNNIIPVDLPLGSDISAVLRPVDKPMPPVSGINEEAQMNRDFQTISQTIDYTDRGGSSGFTNTATGIKSRDSQLNAQVSNVVDHLEDSIAELGMMWLGLAEKMGEDKIMIRRKRSEKDMERTDIPLQEIPDKFSIVDKSVFEDALLKYGVQVEAGSTTYGSASGKAQDAVNLSNTAVQFASMGVPVNLPLIFKELLKDSFSKANPELYLLEQQPVVMPGEEGQGNAMPSNPAKPGGKAPLQPSQPTNPGM